MPVLLAQSRKAYWETDQLSQLFGDGQKNLKGHCLGHLGQSAQIFYKEPGLNMNCW